MARLPLAARTSIGLLGAMLVLMPPAWAQAQAPPDDPAPAPAAASDPAPPPTPDSEKAATRARRPRRAPADPHSPWGQGVRDGSFMGRPLAEVMSWLGADWLVRPEREIEEEPERMLDALELKPGMVVADVGAGVGYTSVRMARRVSPGGKVLATDVQPEMIRLLKQNLAEAGIKNVTPALCTPQDTGLPDGQVDLAIMVDVYHECSHPVETLRGIRQALKPGGRLVLVEYRAEDPDVPIKPEHKMTVAQVRKELEPQGFVFKQNHEFLPWQHILVFEKPAAAAPAPAKGETKAASPPSAAPGEP